jgi:ketol-acid reductoisomerase
LYQSLANTAMQSVDTANLSEEMTNKMTTLADGDWAKTFTDSATQEYAKMSAEEKKAK